jgi:hypothetical protein
LKTPNSNLGIQGHRPTVDTRRSGVRFDGARGHIRRPSKKGN